MLQSGLRTAVGSWWFHAESTDGPWWCDPGFCVVLFRFRMLRRFLAYPSDDVRRSRGHGPVHLFLESVLVIGIAWDSVIPGWCRPGVSSLSDTAGPIQHFRAAILDAWRNKVSGYLCKRKGFRGPRLDFCVSMELLYSSHFLERDKALLRVYFSRRRLGRISSRKGSRKNCPTSLS